MYDAWRRVLELLSEDTDLDKLRSATLAAMTGGELMSWNGKSTRQNDMKLIFEGLEARDLPHGKRTAQRKRFETVLLAAERVLTGVWGTQEGGPRTVVPLLESAIERPSVLGPPPERQQELPAAPQRPAPWVAPRVPDEWHSMDAPLPAGYEPAAMGFDPKLGRTFMELLHPGRGDLPRIWQIDATADVLEAEILAAGGSLEPPQDPWARALSTRQRLTG
jgi:hypothetical protein